MRKNQLLVVLIVLTMLLFGSGCASWIESLREYNRQEQARLDWEGRTFQTYYGPQKQVVKTVMDVLLSNGCTIDKMDLRYGYLEVTLKTENYAGTLSLWNGNEYSLMDNIRILAVQHFAVQINELENQRCEVKFIRINKEEYFEEVNGQRRRSHQIPSWKRSRVSVFLDQIAAYLPEPPVEPNPAQASEAEVVP